MRVDRVVADGPEDAAEVEQQRCQCEAAGKRRVWLGKEAGIGIHDTGQGVAGSVYFHLARAVSFAAKEVLCEAQSIRATE